MAAPASSKPGLVHYSCAFFVVTTLICGVGWYMSGSAYAEREGSWQTDQKKAQEMTSANSLAVQNMTLLKNKIGFTYESIGAEGDANNNTVIGAANETIKLAGDLAQPTMAATIQKLAEELNNARNLIATKDGDIASRNSTILALETKYNELVKAETEAKTGAETRLQGVTTEAAEDRAKKDKEIEDQRVALKETQDELARTEDELKKYVERAEKRERTLQDSVQRLLDELRTLRNYGFEQPLGKIVRVDTDSNTVTLNLGKADRLSKRTTFSVYTKANSGVARGAEDIKGSIEVIDVLGPHLSLARITGETMPADPIAPGDPIYTPAWSPGRIEKFAIVGKFDFDGDGKDDRPQLYELIATNGAMIGAEVDQKGVRNDRRIDPDTKFLVVGDIPDPTEIVEPEERRAVEEIKKHHEAMKKEADEQGVTVVRKNDFLSWMGYRPQYKVYKVGDPRPNTLSGSRTNGNSYSSGSRTGSMNKDK